MKMEVNLKKRLFSLANILSLFENSSEKNFFYLKRLLIESIGHAEEFSHSLLRVQKQSQKKQAVKEAHQHIKRLQKSLRQALASTKYLRAKGRGEREKYFFFDHLYGSCGLILSLAENLRVPPQKTINWIDEVENIEEQVGEEGIIGCCSEIIELLENYDDGKISLQRKF